MTALVMGTTHSYFGFLPALPIDDTKTRRSRTGVIVPSERMPTDTRAASIYRF